MSELQHHFEAFASFGGAHSKEMDNSHFSKMMKECGLIDKVFTTTDVDMLFTKVKAKGERKITFQQFVDSVIPAIAAKKGLTEEQVAERIGGAAPQSSGTKAEATRFHDDKSAYTGVYKAGGPTNVDRNAGNLSGVVDRRVDADVRGATGTQKQSYH
jgi:hypothetical protein